MQADPRFLRTFLEEDYERLYQHYQNWTVLDFKYLHFVKLVWEGKKQVLWTYLKPITTRRGEVVDSNIWSLPPGTIIKSRIPFRHAGRQRQGGILATLGDPRQLEVVSLPANRNRRKSRGQRKDFFLFQKRAA